MTRVSVVLLLLASAAAGTPRADRAECSPEEEDDGVGLLQSSSRNSPLQLQSEGRLKVAYAIFVTDLQSQAWQDAMAIMAHGLQKVKAKSKHDATALVLAPDRLPDDAKSMLLSFGFDDVVRRPVPVPVSEIQSTAARKAMGHTQGAKGMSFALEEETVKYWGLSLTQFDRVVVLDADTMVLDPMDELIELPDDFVGTYDHDLECMACGSRLPPVQGGFLLFRPNATDFENIKALTREGNFSGTGWKNSGVGYWYGGIGPDGLLQYYFNKDALENLPQRSALENPSDHRELEEGIAKPSLPGSRMKAVDRDVYDVLIADRFAQDFLKDGDATTVASGVKTAHFAGECIKPWTCIDLDRSKPGSKICEALHARWGEMWAEVATKRLGTSSATATGSYCKAGRYVDLPAAPKP
jgi:hypothetical protein